MEKKEMKGILIPANEYYAEATWTADLLIDIVEKQTIFAKKFHSLFVQNVDEKVLEDSGSARREALTKMIQGNLTAITQEAAEARDWLPWKHWRRYQGFDIDLEEIRFEYIDMLHFLIEGMILLGMNGEDIHRYYCSKMKENLARQERGY